MIGFQIGFEMSSTSLASYTCIGICDRFKKILYGAVWCFFVFCGLKRITFKNSLPVLSPCFDDYIVSLCLVIVQNLGKYIHISISLLLIFLLWGWNLEVLLASGRGGRGLAS